MQFFGAEPLELAAARLAIDEQPTEELPRIATEALVRGFDSPSLRLAAGMSSRDVRDAREAFLEALEELDIEVPNVQDALWYLIRVVLKSVVDGSSDAAAAASWIWRSAHLRFDREGDLRIFVGLASEWDDHRDSRPDIEAAIRDAAADLLARDQPRRWLKLHARIGRSPVSEPATDAPCPIDDLPLDNRLKRELHSWTREFDDVQTHPGSGPSGFEHIDAAARFVERGKHLVAEMQHQLGDGWHVEYMPTARAFPPPRG